MRALFVMEMPKSCKACIFNSYSDEWRHYCLIGGGRLGKNCIRDKYYERRKKTCPLKAVKSSFSNPLDSIPTPTPIPLTEPHSYN